MVVWSQAHVGSVGSSAIGKTHQVRVVRRLLVVPDKSFFHT